ncbi:MAG: threonine--tRNA ligase [Oscillospiraceae bacterium]|nr:threonine--tRNA ligase [Oscillospiraceae bacterium]
MIKVFLKENSCEREYPEGTTVYDVFKETGQINDQLICAGKIDGKVVDLRELITADCEISKLDFNDADGKKVYWHTCAHILAQAVKRVFKDAKLAIGPSTDNGFYYDIDLDKTITPDDLEVIQKEIEKIIKEDLNIEKFTLPADEALKLMEEKNEIYKIELIKEHSSKGEDIQFYKQGEFTDLCRGPHLTSTGSVKILKLTSCTGAYWRADAKNKMLQRIYGISFPDKDQLDEYLKRIEEAKKRDHRKLGRELDLFDIYEEGPGFPFFLPKGMILRNILEDFWRKEHEKNGYQEIKTPIILNQDLWYRSGHWDHYKDNMYTTKIDDMDYAVKPMNCPGGMLVYKRKLHSYRDLPQKIAELGLVHRHELSGTLHGLMRVRCFTQDDAHIFMTESQIEEEILNVMKLVDKFYSIFGFKYTLELSTKPENSMGAAEQWEIATESLKKALDLNGKPYKINEGDGAFYGPKIDFHIEDSIGRTWQCGTIQLDFQMPERFDLTYIDQDNSKKRPIMIHRVIFGSIERFIGILVEHCAGALPTWLTPEQVRILPISDKQHEYAKKIEAEIKGWGLRASIDDRSEKIGYKIREAQVEKVPYMVVIGDKEVQNQNISVRNRKKGDLGQMKLSKFIEIISKEIQDKQID